MYNIKSLPKDFIVKEIISLTKSPKGKFAFFLLKKQNLNTYDAIKLVARKLGLNPKNVGFCGNKDKKAITYQYISIPATLHSRAEKIKEKRIELKFCGYANQHLFLGAHEGNKFEVTLRDVSAGAKFNETEYMPNYFGEQRFSSKNVEVGRALINKDYRKASEIIQESAVSDHLQQKPSEYVNAISKVHNRVLLIYVHAYQSCLFNRALSSLIIKSSDYVMHKLGSFEFAFPKVVEKKDIDLNIPLIGFDTIENASRTELYKEIIKSENLNFKNFVNKQIPNLSLPGEERAAFVRISDLKCRTLSNDKETMKLSFSLPKGSYATVALKALIKSEQSSP